MKYGSDVDAVNAEGGTAEDYARHAMRELPVWRLRAPPSYTSDETWRGAGVVEGNLAILRDFRAAGKDWKRYVAEPRKQLLVLRKLVERGRARPPRWNAKALAGLLARNDLPDVLFWKVLAFWRSDRDV